MGGRRPDGPRRHPQDGLAVQQVAEFAHHGMELDLRASGRDALPVLAEPLLQRALFGQPARPPLHVRSLGAVRHQGP